MYSKVIRIANHTHNQHATYNFYYDFLFLCTTFSSRHNATQLQFSVRAEGLVDV